MTEYFIQHGLGLILVLVIPTILLTVGYFILKNKTVKKTLDLLDKYTPLWLITNLITGAGVGGGIGFILSTHLGHRVSYDAYAHGVAAVSPFAHIAPWIGLAAGIVIALFYTYLDIKAKSGAYDSKK